MTEPDSQFSESDLYKTIGQQIAEGYSNQEIKDALFEMGCTNPEMLLRNVYSGWAQTHQALALNASDLLNWHLLLRHRILKFSLEERTVPGGQLALRILDSMANLQNLLDDRTATNVPIEIRLLPATESDFENAADDDNDNELQIKE